MSFRLQRLTRICRIFLAIIAVLFRCLPVNGQCDVKQIHKLVREDSDQFGLRVAIDGTIAVIGECCPAPTFVGSAYLYDTNTGEQLFELQSNDGADHRGFGNGVAIDGKIALVGANGYESAGVTTGSVFVFDTSIGQQIRKLLAEDGEDGDSFGKSSLGLSGTIAIVGADGDDDNGDNSGSAYLLDVTTGEQLHKLLPLDGAAEDRFGAKVALSGTTAIVGARLIDDNGNNSGSAYLFDTATGQQLTKLLPNDGVENHNFGNSVAIDGSIAIVGARWDDENGENAGAAYLFDVTTGIQVFKLLADDGAPGDEFGYRVAISKNIVAIGARGDDDNGDWSGSAYLFDAATGKQLEKLVANDGAADDEFGQSLAISGTTAIVGAWLDDSGNNNDNSGSAYLFEVSCHEVDVVNADDFNVLRGFHVAGVLSDTFESDDSYLKFTSGLTINSAEPPVWIEFEGTLPSDSPTSLSVTLEAQAGTTGLTQTIEMFNWNTGQYEQVDAQSASWNEDSIVTVELTFFISDFVQGGTGAVETRVGWNDTGPILNYPWTICIDQVVWTVIQ